MVKFDKKIKFKNVFVLIKSVKSFSNNMNNNKDILFC